MSDTVACRICLEDTGTLISPCGCKGSTANIHPECLKKWVASSGSQVCEICKTEYARHEVIGCNITNYCDGIFQSPIRSAIELNLIKLSSLHCVVGILMYSWSNMDEWMMISSIQTVVHTLCVILFQIYHYNVEFFVLRVLIYWSIAYLIGALVVGTIRTIDNQDECTLNCFKYMQEKCGAACVVYDYYINKDEIASNVMIIRLIETTTLLLIRAISLCFTHMRRSEYYNFKAGTPPSVASSSASGSEEEEPLLVEISV